MTQQKSNIPITTLSSHGTPVGSFSVQDGRLLISDDADDALRGLLQKSALGITYTQYAQQGGRRFAFFETTFPGDEIFGEQLVRRLKDAGYELYEEISSLNQVITQLLMLLPEDNQFRKDMLEQVPDMTYLEKTMLKRELEKRFDALADQQS